MPKFFEIDKSLHQIGNAENCCYGFEDPCEKQGCNGIVHFQPVYDGIARICDTCGIRGMKVISIPTNGDNQPTKTEGVNTQGVNVGGLC